MENLILKEEQKELIAFIKERYPVGSEIWDDTRSGPFIVWKNSIFEVFELDYAERPDDADVYVEFYVRKPGKYSDRFYIKAWPKKWLLKKYQK